MNHTVPGAKMTIVSHPRMHLSDYLAAYFLRQYGAEKYGENATIPGWRTVMVGRGGYDEHGEPKAHECEATLVAKDLGVANLPELKPILDYTLGVDRFGQGKGVLKFGRLVELAHDAFRNQESAERWTNVMIAASIDAAKRGIHSDRPDLIVYLLVWRAWEKIAHGYSRGERESLERHLATTTIPQPVDPFSLHHCAGILWRYSVGLPEDEREEKLVLWIEYAIRAELAKQRKFFAAKKEFDAEFEGDGGNIDELHVTVRGQEYMVLLARSGNERIQSLCFHESQSVGVVAVRRPNGQMQIFRRQRAPFRIGMEYATALIRACEQAIRDHPISSWIELTAQHGPEGAECWFYQHATQYLFNGSLTAPDIEPTRLDDEIIQACLRRGLSDEFAAFRQQLKADPAAAVRAMVMAEAAE